MNFKERAINKYTITGKERTDFSNETYWSCFGYEDYIPDDLHCTHKFFGEQTSEQAENIKNLMDAYFLEHPFQAFTLPFSHEEFFGVDKDVRVLRPTMLPDGWQKPFLMDLREKLDAFADDNHPGYKPHVSTPDMEEVALPFTRYCFCRGDKIIAEYK